MDFLLPVSQLNIASRSQPKMCQFINQNRPNTKMIYEIDQKVEQLEFFYAQCLFCFILYSGWPINKVKTLLRLSKEQICEVLHINHRC